MLSLVEMTTVLFDMTKETNVNVFFNQDGAKMKSNDGKFKAGIR